MERGRAATPARVTGGSLGAPGALARRLESARFRAEESHELSTPLRLPSAADALTYLRDTHPTLDEMVAPLSADERNDVWARVEAALAKYVGPDGFESPNRAVVVAGMRATEPTGG